MRTGPVLASIVVAILSIQIGFVIGCASGKRAATDSSRPDSPRPGDRLVSMSAEWRDSDGARVSLHEIRRDGTIAFGGGFDAASGRTTWSGPLADDERAAIVALLRADGWLDGAVTGRGDPKSLRGDVRLVTRDGRKRHTIRGESPEFDRLRAALDQATAARFDSTMRALPKAGEQRR